jgi:hypothetical protein
MRRLPHAGQVPSREESNSTTTDLRKETTMFLHLDPQAQLDLAHQRSAELARQAADYRRARAARGEHGRSAWWRRKDRGDRSTQVSVAA